MTSVDMTLPEQLDKESLGEKLATIVQKLPAKEITLGKILDIFKSDGLLIFSIFLSLVFLIPVSIPGVSTAFGFAILLIGISRLFNRHFRLPNRLASRVISADKLAEAFSRAIPWLRKFEHISRPHRLGWIATQAAMAFFNKLGFVAASLLLMMPLSFVPFSNTIPAVALIFFAIGELEKDGVSILAGHAANLAATIYFAFLFAAGGITIFEGMRFLP